MQVRTIVLDTNVIVSALVYGGIPAQLLRRIIKGELIGVTSDFIITEVNDVLLRDKIGFSERKVEAVRKKIKETFRVVHPSVKVHVLSDEPDNRILETAIKGRCQYIVTGDKELLELGNYESVEIVTPRDFLDLILNK